ncbi:Endophilin-A3 [Chytriomyces hyalinus]|nr:Endophilin-A3 [Chytriomyces hyalinus]
MDLHFRDHLIKTIFAQIDVLLQFQWIDAAQHANIILQLPTPSAAPQSTTSVPTTPSIHPSTSIHLSLSSARDSITPNMAVSRKSSVAAQNPIRIAIKDFQSGVDGDLAFRVGDLIEVVAEVDDNWMTGTLSGKTGIFPKEFTEPKVLVKAAGVPATPPPIHSRPMLTFSPIPAKSSLSSSSSSFAAGVPPPLPPPLSSKPSSFQGNSSYMNTLSMISTTSSNANNSGGGSLPIYNKQNSFTNSRSSTAHSLASSFHGSFNNYNGGSNSNPNPSILSTGSIPQPLPTTQPTDQQYFYLRSRANGNVLGVEMGLTSMVTHDSPILVVALNAVNKSSEQPLLLRMDEGGCLVTPSNLAVDVRVGEWVNGGTVVLAKRVAVVAGGAIGTGSISEGNMALQQQWEIRADGVILNERGFMLVEDYGRAVVWDCSEEEVIQQWDMVMM